MKFITSLLKGFFRSAINQIGRDGGKVVSNKIYGKSHSSPISVSSSEESTDDPEANSIDARKALADNDYTSELLKSNILVLIVLTLLGAVFPILGPLYWVYLGIRNLFKGHTKFYRWIKKPSYVRDRRYNSGQRQEGYTKEKEYADIVLKPILKEKLIYISKGIIAFSIAFTMAGTQYSLYVNDQETKTSEISGIIIAQHGAHLRESPSGTSPILSSIPNNDTIKIISTDGPIETIGNKSFNWLEVEHDDKKGWVWGGLVEYE